MKNKILSIDFEIIWKSIHSHLDHEEQLLLDKWLDEDQKHRSYYQKAQKHLSETEIHPVKADLNKLWQDITIEEGVNHSDKKKKRLLLSVAASIAILIASYVLYPSLTSDSDIQTASRHLTYPAPGQHKAILHLENGKQLVLGENADHTDQAVQDVMEIHNKSLRYKNRETSSSAQPMVMHVLEVPRGGEFMLTLTDGTKIWLNAQSTLKYPVTFDQDKRVVELTGEAYFEVFHDESRPFEVISGDQTLRVLGTSFNINYYPEENEIISTLVEGKISINTSGGPQAILSPGDQAIYKPEQQSLEKQQVNTQYFIAWKNGLFYFQDKSLDHIMKVLSRWYEIEVFYDNPKKQNIRFTGALKRYESFKEVIDLIELTDDVKFTIKENVIIIE